ncbi:hypothetical protein P154DRAFT_201206 [Amniculicola lignicola CBS 123094]|uniref:Uncharacterized protein n=1 Tax=Amniculicola lignicola CBS 123094 TaxID=1392246 RepID=A0A6A5WFI1_9PLEO|nr:hypothetical protein P154DRAFT_201206 [Amniculicola lignicola CBS 123094]
MRFVPLICTYHIISIASTDTTFERTVLALSICSPNSPGLCRRLNTKTTSAVLLGRNQGVRTDQSDYEKGVIARFMNKCPYHEHAHGYCWRGREAEHGGTGHSNRLPDLELDGLVSPVCCTRKRVALLAGESQ